MTPGVVEAFRGGKALDSRRRIDREKKMGTRQNPSRSGLFEIGDDEGGGNWRFVAAGTNRSHVRTPHC
ncbi:hypothetical protein NUU61_003250 [Penicillium alfredii]|uniref:Uncharacterized protein n=1 Tax=Penicillium alfredii TaxID=1506179 RepID=A0A9W9FT71_9EURO|nr:uncharacterized protein NUU61_003250 [Penicillium alfredii]KAJ5105903.1 hypothetical protein NUU61_003250 [Penicillium alfredii]